jgi:YbbR domain-containing protein
MKRVFTENIGWKLLSVALAFMLWVVLAREPELATSISAPVLFRNIPDDLDMSGRIPDRVQLELRGPSGRLTPQSLAQTAVVLDLDRTQPGQQTFTIQETNIKQMPIGVAFYRAVPSQITLQLEHLATKDVPIEPVYSRFAPAGYGIAKYQIDPPKARLRGPETNLQRIASISTDPIDLGDIVGQAERRVQVHIGDPQVRIESSPMVIFRVTLRKTANKDAK